MRTPDVEAAWQALFGHRERTDLTVEELAGRVEAAAAAVTRFRSEHNFMRLPLADYETLEKDALGPRALPLARYESFAATLLAGSGARALYSVPRPTATPDPQLGLAQDIVWNETRPVQEKKVGDNKVVRATMLNSLRQLSVTPPDELTRSIIAFVGINAPDQAGSTTGPNALVLVDVVKGAADTDPVYAYVGHGPDGEVVAHEFAHLMSWRVCGGMLDAQGNWVDPLFTSLVPGFTFSAQAEATLLQVGVYRGWTSWEIPQSAPVAVARPYGARNPEEAQAVLNGELLMDSRFVGRLYTDAPGADLDAVKVQLAVWMARLAKSRPESYAYYRLTADLARLRATLRQRLEPFEVRAAELTGRVDTIYTSTNPAVLALRRGGMTRLKQAEDVATMALTGLPPYPASAFSQFRD